MVIHRLSGSYTEGLTDASLSVLLELAITLRSYKDAIFLVGGWVPYFLIEEFGKDEFTHVGSIDIDLAINPEKIDQNQYAEIIELIERRGYIQRLSRNGQPIQFSYKKKLSSIDHKEYDISVDFLTSRAFDTKKHRHRRIQPGLNARVTEGCEIAFKHNMTKKLSGLLPDNGEVETDIKMLDIAGCICMKGIVLGEAYREKDAYDIYSVVSQCLDNPKMVAKEVKSKLTEGSMLEGIESIKKRFRNIRAEGPSWVSNFLQANDKTAKDRIIAEVFVVMQEFIDNLK